MEKYSCLLINYHSMQSRCILALIAVCIRDGEPISQLMPIVEKESLNSAESSLHVPEWKHQVRSLTNVRVIIQGDLNWCTFYLGDMWETSRIFHSVGTLLYLYVPHFGQLNVMTILQYKTSLCNLYQVPTATDSKVYAFSDYQLPDGDTTSPRWNSEVHKSLISLCISLSLSLSLSLPLSFNENKIGITTL